MKRLTENNGLRASEAHPEQVEDEVQQPKQPVCQICGGRLIEIRGKLQCERCHTIWETCCEGGRW